MSVFDLHFHPVFKQAITRFEEVYPSQRTAGELSEYMDLTHWLPDRINEWFLHILESQCCIRQLQAAGNVVGVAAIAPIERFFTHREGLFGKLLNGDFTDPFDKTCMDRIRAGEIGYYQLFLKELGLYRILRDAKVVNFITRTDKAGLHKEEGIHLALGLEGGHALARTKIGKPGVPDVLAAAADNVDPLWQDLKDHPIVHPAEALGRLQQALWDDGLDLCYLTLTHLSHISEQYLATHAYGMKMIEAAEAFPQGHGLSSLGKEVVEKAYTLTVKVKDDKGKLKEHPATVMIDIKHMGLRARLDLYAFRKSARFNGVELPPIIATHMGVTGYSVQAWTNALVGNTARLERKHDCVGFTLDRQIAGRWGFVNASFSFNAWSVNLMDEDIIEVLASKGIIGVSLDVRILGWQDAVSKGDVEEFMSREDFRSFFPQQYARIGGGPAGAEESWVKPTKEERHPLALCFNVLHIASVGKVNGFADVWDRICIGSDMDGLIDPVKICRDASNFADLRNNLMRWLPVAEEAYRKEMGGPALLPDDMGDLVDRIMQRNGRSFLTNEWK